MRHFICSVLILLVSTFPAMAQEKLSPPLTGEMYRMEIFEKPITVPELMISSRATGLKYFSDYRGKIILLNIWATWCPPCVAEMPSLNALQTALGDDKLVIVAVSLDKDIDAAKKFMDDNNLDKLTPYIDTNGDVQKMEALNGVDGIPVTLVIDQNMQVVARFQGDADWNGKESRAVIDYLIEHIKAKDQKSDQLMRSMQSLSN